MPSVGPMSAGLRNGVTSHYMILSTIGANSFFQYTAPAGSGGAFGPATVASNFSVYSWAQDGTTVNTSTLLQAGNVLRDMGKSVNASGSTFRKVQFLIPGNLSTAGVGGNVTGVTQVQGTKTGYGSGYILVPSEGNNGNDTATPLDLATTTGDMARVVRMY